MYHRECTTSDDFLIGNLHSEISPKKTSCSPIECTVLRYDVQLAGMKDSPFRTVYLFEFERERRSPLGRRWVITVRSHFTARQLRRTTSTKGPTGLAWLSPVFTLDSALTSSLTTIKLYHHLPSSLRASPSILTLNTRHPSSMPAILVTNHRRTTPAATARQSLDKPPPIGDYSSCRHHPDWPTLSCTG
jgi:hypothetical protein